MTSSPTMPKHSVILNQAMGLPATSSLRSSPTTPAKPVDARQRDLRRGCSSGETVAAAASRKERCLRDESGHGEKEGSQSVAILVVGDSGTPGFSRTGRRLQDRYIFEVDFSLFQACLIDPVCLVADHVGVFRARASFLLSGLLLGVDGIINRRIPSRVPRVRSYLSQHISARAQGARDAARRENTGRMEEGCKAVCEKPRASNTEGYKAAGVRVPETEKAVSADDSEGCMAAGERLRARSTEQKATGRPARARLPVTQKAIRRLEIACR
ncbi:hypothetical protein Bbelb_048120 [Branchiostoma belcheri]|nr:hypothetical protein Bbelb_048120 [Branchiostoma belcheri]